MSIYDKILNAKPTKWPAGGFSDKEIRQIVQAAQRAVKESRHEYRNIERKPLTVKDLISKKDYDCITWRIALQEGIDETSKSLNDGSIFAGVTKSKDGKLVSLDGDNYSENEEVLDWYEWHNEKVHRGLTIIVKGEHLGIKLFVSPDKAADSI